MAETGNGTHDSALQQGSPIEAVDIVIVGGGSAGLAAAIAARQQGIDSIVILEREGQLGGILNQCIHNGFGLHTFKEELTGPEYAARFIEQAEQLHIDYRLSTTVLDITDGRLVTAVSADRGVYQLQATAIVLAMGCRERPRGALNTPGYRPAGVYTAGCAQRLVNIDGELPGKEVVILGSGDIGLIMARRLTFEGAHVACVAEVMPYSGGLKRNIVQCLDDFGIPLLLSHTVVDIEGEKRVEAVTIAQVDEQMRPIAGTERRYPCDTLLLSVGLLPENELSRQAGIKINPVTRGAYVNESLETSVSGIFACGNVLHVHDLVDYVSEEAACAGACAAEYVARSAQGGAHPAHDEITLRGENGVRYTVPSSISPSRMPDELVVRFRVGKVFENAAIGVWAGQKRISRRKRPIMAPGEMQEIRLKKSDLAGMDARDELRIVIEEA